LHIVCEPFDIDHQTADRSANHDCFAAGLRKERLREVIGHVFEFKRKHSMRG